MASFVNEEFVKSLTAQGGRTIKSFTGGNRDMSSRLEVGDAFTIPKDFTVYEQPIAGSRNKWQFTRVDVGKGVMKNIGASVFNRRLQEVNEDGEPTGNFLSASGTVSEEFLKHGSIQEAFEAIAGKAMKVTAVVPGTTRSFRPDEKSATTYFYTIDFVKTSRK